jgi:FtsH-binding integral membrane protein
MRLLFFGICGVTLVQNLVFGWFANLGPHDSEERFRNTNIWFWAVPLVYKIAVSCIPSLVATCVSLLAQIRKPGGAALASSFAVLNGVTLFLVSFAHSANTELKIQYASAHLVAATLCLALGLYRMTTRQSRVT